MGVNEERGLLGRLTLKHPAPERLLQRAKNGKIWVQYSLPTWSYIDILWWKQNLVIIILLRRYGQRYHRDIKNARFIHILFGYIFMLMLISCIRNFYYFRRLYFIYSTSARGDLIYFRATWLLIGLMPLPRGHIHDATAQPGHYQSSLATGQSMPLEWGKNKWLSNGWLKINAYSGWPGYVISRSTARMYAGCLIPQGIEKVI